MTMATPVPDKRELRKIQAERRPLPESLWRRLIDVLIMEGRP